MKSIRQWERGLSSEEAADRLSQQGPNALPASESKSGLTIAMGVVREPMFLLLLGASSIYFVLGDFREAVVLFLSVFVVLGITFYQERKTERALEALRDLSSPRALVIRDGVPKRIPGRDVVLGDIVLLKEGDRIPADAVLLLCNNLAVDESLLTGESVVVMKRAGSLDEPAQPPGGDGLPFIYSGTLITQGQGTAQVLATGMMTEIGRIGKALEQVRHEPSLIEKETRRAVMVFACIGLTLCSVVVILYGILLGDWLNGFLAGITLAMANLPEEFPVVLTVFLALGAWRISRQGVLTRQPPAIETLGATTVLCVDKTGTLTQNHMVIRELWCDGEQFPVEATLTEKLPERFCDLVKYGILSSELEPFDPMERAFIELGKSVLDQNRNNRFDWQIVREYPFAAELPAHAHVWSAPELTHFVAATKGAPEAIADICGLDETKRAALFAAVAAMAATGLRVLAVGKAKLPLEYGKDIPWPTSQHHVGFALIGLVGFADPIRPTVPAAIVECYNAGIRTVMITGDYPGTAQAIAKQIGLHSPNNIMTGAELASMSDEVLASRIGDVNIFARIVPEQKLRIVQSLKALGEVVAMTGDGVNDAPALKSAHIGVAMGARGTDVAREASSLVLLEDDFASLVHAVRLGRRIFDNIQKAMCYIVAVHVPTAGLALLPLVLGWPLVLYPVHIVFLEFVIDPACSIVFEAEPAEEDIMRRPPRAKTARLFDGWMIAGSAAQGLGVLISTAMLYGLILANGIAENIARAMAFTTLVLGNLGLILNNRTRHGAITNLFYRANPALWWIVIGTLIALSVVLSVPSIRELFKFEQLDIHHIALCVISAAVGLVWYECHKLFKRLVERRKVGLL